MTFNVKRYIKKNMHPYDIIMHRKLKRNVTTEQSVRLNVICDGDR